MTVIAHKSQLLDSLFKNKEKGKTNLDELSKLETIASKTEIVIFQLYEEDAVRSAYLPLSEESLKLKFDGAYGVTVNVSGWVLWPLTVQVIHHVFVEASKIQSSY